MSANSQVAPILIKEPYRVTVGGTAGLLTSSGNVHGVILKAICPGQTIYIGLTTAVTTATGYPMADGETLMLEVKNANNLAAIASAAGQSLSVMPFYRGSQL